MPIQVLANFWCQIKFLSHFHVDFLSTLYTISHNKFIRKVSKISLKKHFFSQEAHAALDVAKEMADRFVCDRWHTHIYLLCYKEAMTHAHGCGKAFNYTTHTHDSFHIVIVSVLQWNAYAVQHTKKGKKHQCCGFRFILFAMHFKLCKI